MNKEQILADLREVVAGPSNRYIEEWRKSGGLVAGYFCTYVPREMFTAAGILPVRIRGAGSTDSGPADTYLSNRVCTFVRHATTLAMEEKYDFLDAAVFVNTCDHVRRSNDVWRHKTNIGHIDLISVPRTPRDALLPWYIEEVERVKSGLEQRFGVKITEQGLRQAIEQHNRVRERLIALNDLRGAEMSPLSGEEMLVIAVAAQLMPPDKFVSLADELLADLSGKTREGPPPRARVVVAGGELDEPQFIKIIESQGAAVVADNVCFSYRSFSQLVQAAGDPFEAMCRSYLFHVPCARMIGQFPARYEEIMALVRKYKADGVIFQRQKFCDPWGGDAHNMLHRKKTTGMHLLVLDREYGVISTGQIKTRVQAFLESMGK